MPGSVEYVCDSSSGEPDGWALLAIIRIADFVFLPNQLNGKSGFIFMKAEAGRNPGMKR
jgi:hypothetical protein